MSRRSMNALLWAVLAGVAWAQVKEDPPGPFTNPQQAPVGPPAGAPLNEGGPGGTGGNARFYSILVATGIAFPTFNPLTGKDAVPIPSLAAGEYFQAFGRRSKLGVDLGAHLSGYPNHREEQLDAALSWRIHPEWQTSAFGSVGWSQVSGLNSTASFAQGGFVANWIFPQRPVSASDGSRHTGTESAGNFGGYLGGYVTFADGEHSEFGERLGPSFLRVRPMHEFGARSTLTWRRWGWWENPVIDVGYAYLHRSGGAHGSVDAYGGNPADHGHTAWFRFTSPFYASLAVFVEYSLNPTLVRGDQVSNQILFGVRFGIRPAPLQTRGQSRVHSVENPAIRYQIRRSIP